MHSIPGLKIFHLLFYIVAPITIGKFRTKTVDLCVTASTSQQPGAQDPWLACLVCALPARPKPQSG